MLSVSPVLQRHLDRIWFAKYLPTKAALYRIEAMADHRCDNDVSAMSKLEAIRDICREACVRDNFLNTGTEGPFFNPLYD